MSKKINYKFTVARKGGESAGKVFENEVPDFDWEEFKKLPLAKLFAKKAYFEEVKKIMREIEEDRKNQTMKCDLQSMESIIARSLKFTKEEISEWFDKRNWGKFPKLKNPEVLKGWKIGLLTLSQGPVVFGEESRKKYADYVAGAADKPTDDVADYLFSRLSLESDWDGLDY